MDLSVEEMGASAAKSCALLKSMANETRLMILCQLSARDMTVGELLETIPLSQSALSQHLGVLRKDGLVRTRRNAQFITYTLDSLDAQKIIETLYGLYCSTDADECGLSAKAKL